MRRLTEEQAPRWKRNCDVADMDAQTFVGMCTWKPFLSEAVERSRPSGVDRLVILPLFPHYSFTTTGAGFGRCDG